MDVLNKVNDKLKYRFYFKVKKLDNGCHLWTGAITMRNMYGSFSVLGHTIKAHRMAWILVNNRDIPKGLCICHKCDNPTCVNPEHLFLGTFKDNNRDMINKGRNINGNAKLKEQDICKIYTLYDKGFRTETIAKRFKISISSCQRIVSGTQWIKVFKKHKRTYKSPDYFKRHQVFRIYKLCSMGLTNVEVGKLFDVTSSAISSIKLGHKYKYYYEEYYN